MAGEVLRTLLQLLPATDVVIVPTTTVSRWVTNYSPPLPCWSDPDPLTAAAQNRAVEAAAFAAAFREDRRYFPEAGDDYD